jgi:hypothetical protein
MKYMLMMHAPRGTGNWGVFSWPPRAIKAHIEFMQRLVRDLSQSGELVGAEGLTPPAQTRIVRAVTGGAPQVTDGPFAETKEFLAGYWIVDCATPERAYEIAARASAAPGSDGGPLNMPIEVRPVASTPSAEVS